MNSVAVFVDVGNLFYCIGKRFERRKLDYEKYLDIALEGDSELDRAFAYGTKTSDNMIGFINCLQYIGYETKFEEARVVKGKYVDGKLTENKVFKIDWSVGICIDVVKTIDKVNTIVLGSSDLSLIPLIHWIKDQNRNCVIIACGIHREVRNICTQWIEIDERFLEPLNNATSETT